jgi:hypothetical protein
LTEQEPKKKAGFFNSKYWKMLLVLVMALLLFGAPYATYISFFVVMKRHFLISTMLGFGAVVLGLLLMWYLIRTKVIT